MTCVNVLINLPSKKFDSSFTYSVPGHLLDEIEFGKRVLVEFGKRKVEGYVIGEELEPEPLKLKPIIKVLDTEPVIDNNLYQLARWMADYYLCPLTIALDVMIPRNLTKKLSKYVISLIKEDEIDNLPLDNKVTVYRDFFSKLFSQTELSLNEALKYIDNDELQQLQSEGLIYIGGSYSGYRDIKAGYVYVLKDFNPTENMPVLQKKAPRQAEVMEMMIQNKEIDREILDKAVPLKSINSLIRKGYIGIARKSRTEYSNRPVLNAEQKNALESIAKAISGGSRSGFLLHGITGSGKTEVYLQAAQKAIELGKSVIVLVPEIALTRHLVDIFSKRVENMAVLHSSMPAGERYDEWKRIRRGEVDVVLGTRSAIFAPLANLGLIIIDEEQETTYKQEETPRYHAREVAYRRAEIESAVIVLGSATPCLETFYQAMNGQLNMLSLKKRVRDARMPSVKIEDMRTSFKKRSKIISPVLQEKIENILIRGEQCILFINRRGYSPMTICGECGIISSCPHCSVGMTYHRDLDLNVCHYCNYQTKVPVKCSSCGSSHMQQIGYGTQRVEEEVKLLFPAARIERLDLDSSRRKGSQKNILERMKNKDIDILIGTQMVAKGLDFPGVSLVGIVDADSMLNLPDFRAGERCFQLIVQAAGRAGRGHLAGQVIIQTYKPDDMVIQMASKQDYLGFYSEEIRLRKLLNYPPFTNLLRVVVVSQQEKEAQMVASMIGSEIGEITDAKEEDIIVLGPAPCPIQKIKKRFRYQLIVKCDNMLLIRSIGKYIINKKVINGVKLEVDINPVMTM